MLLQNPSAAHFNKTPYYDYENDHEPKNSSGRRKKSQAQSQDRFQNNNVASWNEVHEHEHEQGHVQQHHDPSADGFQGFDLDGKCVLSTKRYIT